MNSSGRPPCHLVLPDGRRLAYWLYGAESGVPVCYFHGFPGSGCEASLAHGRALAAGVTLIAADRPGYGGSTYQPNRTIEHWPSDVAALLDHLALDQAACVGVSGGAPYALACAAFIPDRITTVSTISGLGPVVLPSLIEEMAAFNRLGLRLASASPLAARLLSPALALLLGRFPGRVVDHLRRKLAPADQEALDQGELREALAESFRLSMAPGGRGMALEGVLYAGHWGDWLERIEIPVNLWHGERDLIVPPALGRHLAGLIPHCRAAFLPDDGHFSTVLRSLDDVLADALDCQAPR